MCEEQNNNCCLENTLAKIIKLQCIDSICDVEGGCDKPFLGRTPSMVCYNTRPISLYNCCTGALWSFPYTSGETTANSTVFRAESLDGCCLTCRILIDNGNDTYTDTSEFFTINLKCCGALQCHSDAFVEFNNN